MKYLCFLVAIVFVSCGKTAEFNTQIQLSVNGLKKGKLYLQRVDANNKLQNLDSLSIEQPEATYLLQTNTTAPELMYVYLDKSDGIQYNDRISFFAEPGKFTISTDVYSFEENAEVVGGEHQRLFGEFNAMMDQFN
ncbi:MAG: DUF4369 domain-containing protein, partial [Flavobacteriaceae bacterium]|nr:DUF4369 domain-containing protein [Flavobacteriaceae bacterium]